MEWNSWRTMDETKEFYQLLVHTKTNLLEKVLIVNKDERDQLIGHILGLQSVIDVVKTIGQKE